jgi:hypothetical protein
MLLLSSSSRWFIFCLSRIRENSPALPLRQRIVAPHPHGDHAGILCTRFTRLGLRQSRPFPASTSCCGTSWRLHWIQLRFLSHRRDCLQALENYVFAYNDEKSRIVVRSASAPGSIKPGCRKRICPASLTRVTLASRCSPIFWGSPKSHRSRATVARSLHFRHVSYPQTFSALISCKLQIIFHFFPPNVRAGVLRANQGNCACKSSPRTACMSYR